MQRASHAEPDEDNRTFKIFECTRSAAGFLVRSQSFRPLIGMKEDHFSPEQQRAESLSIILVLPSRMCVQ